MAKLWYNNAAPVDIQVFKIKVLIWLKQFNTFCFLDSNRYQSTQGNYEILVGVGVESMFESSHKDALLHLQEYIGDGGKWCFGHLGYDIATTDNLHPAIHPDELLFPDVCFFEPKTILHISNEQVRVYAENPQAIYNTIQNIHADHYAPPVSFNISIENKIDRQEYISIINALKSHIQRGDCYEINFCQEFFANNVTIDAFVLYNALCNLSPNPFSALYRLNDKWLVCASPERFLQKKGNHILSQPIKGTLQRKATVASGVVTEQAQLLHSAKERAENVMVVDLVRNDLSRVCKNGSVKVDELFGIYTFPQVHQMISTVSGVLKDAVNFTDIINATFPMGSMTGAPKIKVMQLIRQYEKSKRGIFSGSVGYITPNGDFDFNVVIRSVMYNQTSQYLSFQAGSGITIYSDAEKEWEECMVKAKAIKDILSNQ